MLIIEHIWLGKLTKWTVACCARMLKVKLDHHMKRKRLAVWTNNMGREEKYPARNKEKSYYNFMFSKQCVHWQSKLVKHGNLSRPNHPSYKLALGRGGGKLSTESLINWKKD